MTDDEARIRHYVSCGTRLDGEDAATLLATIDAERERVERLRVAIARAAKVLGGETWAWVSTHLHTSDLDGADRE